MVYQGSKAKLVPWLLPLLEPFLAKAPVYYEPFVGGANLICEIPHAVRVGSDANKYLIALLKKVAEDPTVLPRTIDEETYTRVRDHKGEYEPWQVGMVGFCATYRGLYWGGYARDEGGERPRQLLDNLRNQSARLRGIEFRWADYRRINVEAFPGGTLFMCDPPYRNTSGYGINTGFDSDAFYRWCGRVHGAGHTVLLTEFWAPSVFEEISRRERHDFLSAQFQGDEVPMVTERLFIYRG